MASRVRVGKPTAGKLRTSAKTTSLYPSKHKRSSRLTDRKSNAVVRRVVSRLQNIHGVVACHSLTRQQMKELIETEAKSNLRLGLPGLEIVNEGIKVVAKRQHIVAIAHSPNLRHPPGPILVVYNGGEVVGEELWNEQRSEATDDSNTILLGRGLKLYRNHLTRLRGPLKVFYKPLRFPELETIDGVRDAVSITVNTLTHIRLSQLIGWNPSDPILGTVLIGFNESQ